MAKSNYLVNSTLCSNATEEGWVITASNPEIYYFRDLIKKVQYEVESIIIEVAEDSPNAAKICINNLNSYIYIPQGQSEQLDDITIHSLRIISSVATKLRWKGFSNTVSGSYYEIEQ